MSQYSALFNFRRPAIALATTVTLFASLFLSAVPFYFTNAEGPIEIASCEALQMIGQELSHPLDGEYILTGPIDCSMTNPANQPFGYDGKWTDGNGFEPIGVDFETATVVPFTGTLNGNGQTISGLYIDRLNPIIDQGLFSVISGGTVTNLVIDGAYIHDEEGAGVLAGRIEEGANISHVTISNSTAWARFSNYGGGVAAQVHNSTLSNVTISDTTVHGSGNIIGGIAGYVAGSTISDATLTNINVDGGYNVGGAFGELQDSTVTNVHVAGSVLGELDGKFFSTIQRIGGFVGIVESSSIDNSSFTGTVSATDELFFGGGGIEYIGGFAGEAWSSSFSDSFATAGENSNLLDLSATYSVKYIGGFVGYFSDLDTEDEFLPTIENSYAEGPITITSTTNDVEYIGGFAGRLENVQMSDAHFEGEITINAGDEAEDVGGFAGYAYGVAISDSYANADILIVADEVEDIGGFVGYLEESEITDSYSKSKINSTSISDDTQDVGGFVGDFDSNNTISNSYAEVEIVINAGEYYVNRVGGFVGELSGEAGSIDGAHAIGSISITAMEEVYHIGGFIGQARAGFDENGDYEDLTLSNSYAEVDITINSTDSYVERVGGFVGYLAYGAIIGESYATGNIEITAPDYIEYIGGFVGDMTEAEIYRSYATGNVVALGAYFVGGFAGRVNNESSIIDAYARGSVEAGDRVGGFAGEIYYSTVINVYATGLVIGDDEAAVGGLVGYNDGGQVIDSFWDTQTTNQSSSDGGEGRTTAQMKTLANYPQSAGENVDMPQPLTLQAENGMQSYRYFVWRINEVKDAEDAGDEGTYVQASELTLYLNGEPVAWPVGTSITNPGGEFPNEDEEPESLIDGNVNTKWLDENFGNSSETLLFIDAGEQVSFDAYSWATGDDIPGRDPVSWSLYGSNDDDFSSNFGENYTLLDERTDYDVTNNRNVYIHLGTVQGEGWNFDDIWTMQSNKNNGYPFFRWSVLENTEIIIPPTPPTPPTPPRRSGGGTFVGIPSLTNNAPVNTPRSVSTLPDLVNQLRALIVQFRALGGDITPAMQQFLNQDGGGATSSLPVRDLQFGDSGEDVERLQTILINEGYAIPAGATGLFLNQTRLALTSYQSQNGITPAAGYFGPITRAYMKAKEIVGLWW